MGNLMPSVCHSFLSDDSTSYEKQDFTLFLRGDTNSWQKDMAECKLLHSMLTEGK